jgi:hypothetical protein
VSEIFVIAGWRSENVKLGGLLGLLAMVGTFLAMRIFPNTLDSDLDSSMATFAQQLRALLNTTTELTSNNESNRSLFKLCLLLVVGVYGALAGQPALKAASLYRYVLEKDEQSTLQRTLFRINWYMPFCVTLLGVSPLLTNALETEILTAQQMIWLRITCSLLCGVLHLGLVRAHVQVWLDSGFSRAVDVSEGSALSQAHGVAIQKTLRHTLLFAPSLALQYAAPALTWLMCVMLLERSAGAPRSLWQVALSFLLWATQVIWCVWTYVALMFYRRNG